MAEQKTDVVRLQVAGAKRQDMGTGMARLCNAALGLEACSRLLQDALTDADVEPAATSAWFHWARSKPNAGSGMTEKADMTVERPTGSYAKTLSRLPRSSVVSYEPRRSCRKCNPSRANVSWSGASGRQMEAAFAIDSFSSVKDSMTTGPSYPTSWRASAMSVQGR